MTRLTVLSVGRVRTPGLAAAIEEYENRLQHYYRFDSIAVPAAQLPDSRAAAARDEEGDALLKRAPQGPALVALTREGKRWTTRTLADRIQEIQTYGGGGLAFAIGGAHGLAAHVLDRASHRVSLSQLTLPHEVARLVLTEQLYRAGTILRGEPYHKGP
ncbi:MAG: 23S rRNA (pseudouridine(1915)-N(3))-methyltransferase RlmH [Gemmatimonadota bacterium]|nr:23S rRNA (pseudouridine(1915)-N(3))-methyltransferase RlmH [Gemmatimonadota bacterium]